MFPVHGSPQAWMLEPCRNQARWKRLALMAASLSMIGRRRYSAWTATCGRLARFFVWLAPPNHLATVMPAIFAAPASLLSESAPDEGRAAATMVSICPRDRQNLRDRRAAAGPARRSRLRGRVRHGSCLR